MLRAIVFSFLAVFAVSVANAQSASEEQAIKFRKSVMKSVGGAMGGMAAVVKGEVSAEHAVPLAHTMYEVSKVVPHVFPEGSDFGETAALPVIWAKPAEFKLAVAAFQAAALNLSKASHGGDMQAFGQAFGELGKACKGCHENFRKKKEK